MTSGILRSGRVTIARLAALSTVNEKVSVGTFVTIPTYHVGFTGAVSSEAIANRQEGVQVQVGTRRVALAGLAIGRISWFLECQSVSKEARFATFTVESVRVVNASQALTSEAVTVADGVRVNVVVAVAFLAGSDLSKLSGWISKVAIFTLFTP